MKNKIILLSLIAFGLISCSDDETEFANAQLKLKTNKTIIEPFENLKVSIDVDQHLLDLAYDSIIWQANGVASGSSNFTPGAIGDDEFRDIRITDYQLGKHKATALGYKNGSVISQSSIEFEVVKPKGDFLCVKWGRESDVTYPLWYYTEGKTPNHYMPTDKGKVKNGGVSLRLSHEKRARIGEHAELYFSPWLVTAYTRSLSNIFPNIDLYDWDDGDNTLWLRKEDAFLRGYMTELYGEPVLTYDGEDASQTTLWSEYDKRFDNGSSNLYPVLIWDTPTAHICLTHLYQESRGQIKHVKSQLIAEPLKQLSK